MDIFVPIVLCIILFVMFSICGWCCKSKREGIVHGYRNPEGITVTTTRVEDSNVVVPPYPTGPVQHPLPTQPIGFTGPSYPPPPPGFYPYPFASHPMPYPPAGGYPAPQAAVPLYPPQPVPPYPPSGPPTTAPPSYHEAVGQPSISHEGYSKQAPYNPHYQ